MGSPWTTARLVHRTNLGEMSSEKKVVGKMRGPRDPGTISRGLGGSGSTTTWRMEWDNFIGSPNKYFV